MFRILAVGLAALVLSACAMAAEAPMPDAPERSPAEWAALEAEWAVLEDKYLGTEEPSDPLDLLEWREVQCNFLAGELGGDPAQDREINAYLDEICTHQIEDARRLRIAMLSDEAALARIDAFLGRHGN